MFDGMPAADYYKVRGALCSCILATDFSRHRAFLDAARAHGKALKAARGGDAPPGLHDVGWECQLLLKCADISNPAKRLPIACSWALRVTDEFYMQVAACPSRAAPSCQARGGAPMARGPKAGGGAARRAQRGAARGAGRRGALARDAGVAQLRPRCQDAGGDPARLLRPSRAPVLRDVRRAVPLDLRAVGPADSKESRVFRGVCPAPTAPQPAHAPPGSEQVT